MARKKSAPEGDPTGQPSFEEALLELENIVAAMEEEQLPLEELVARYEKGSKLLARCETVLASARKRLQTISAKTVAAADAELPDDPDESQDADDDEPAGLSTGTPDEYDDDDDIRLF